MRNEIESKIGSTIYARIDSLQITEAQRQRALNAMYEADVLVDGMIWFAKKIEHLGERLLPRPALKA